MSVCKCPICSPGLWQSQGQNQQFQAQYSAGNPYNAQPTYGYGDSTQLMADRLHRIEAILVAHIKVTP